jgi:hypothetical protein
MPSSRWFRLTRALALTTICSLPLVPAVGESRGRLFRQQPSRRFRSVT